ncbi:DUF1304 domain-containing protein [uncultured Bifidobacterium sp.]|uniref:DUF1304 domain-containing protein n=1 Tax=uncultured Bifidobacterium sp. TaxID=165187 RepID=UPI0028DAFD44|nr:DUF1304 domain-containing protein [uncultured Bifidobacterium sp.]
MMAVAAAAAAIAAGLFHIVIFVLESFLWTRPATLRAFGIDDPREAEATRGMAYNQGFYNLFLAVIAISGAALALSGRAEPGTALILAGTGSMTAASLALLASDHAKRGPALKQMALPLLSLVLLALSAL